MRVIMFQDRFVDLIKSKQKISTIRKKAGCGIGDILSLRRWTGVPRRSKQEIIVTAVCADVTRVEIYGFRAIRLGSSTLAPSQASALAVRDGFNNDDEMIEWFDKAYGLPFVGEMIFWRIKDECM